MSCTTGHSGQPQDRVHDGEHSEVSRVQHGSWRTAGERGRAGATNGSVRCQSFSSSRRYRNDVRPSVRQSGG